MKELGIDMMGKEPVVRTLHAVLFISLSPSLSLSLSLSDVVVSLQSGGKALPSAAASPESDLEKRLAELRKSDL